MSFTLAGFHAHPDHEALLTAGMLARARAKGHRVVPVTATAGEVGLAASRYGSLAELGQRRVDDLRQSARALGAARVELLGYADFGLDGSAAEPPGPDGRAETPWPGG